MNKLTFSAFALLLFFGLSGNTYAANLVCEPAGGSGGAFCDAQPLGQANYQWDVTFQANLEPECYENIAFCSASCNGVTTGSATITVTISDGNGNSNSASQNFYCNSGGSGGGFN